MGILRRPPIVAAFGAVLATVLGGCAAAPDPAASPIAAAVFVNRSRGGELNYLAGQLAAVCEEEASHTDGLTPGPDGPRARVTGEFTVQNDAVTVVAQWTEAATQRTGDVTVRRTFGKDPARLTAIQREVALKVLAALCPDAWLVHARLGNTLRRQGLKAEARDAYRVAATRATAGGDRARARFLEGYVSDELADRDGAEKAYRAAIDADPELHEARFNLGLVLAARGRHADARTVLAEAQRRRPDDPEVPLALADVAAASGDRKGALVLYADAVRLAPDAVLPRFNLARALADEHRYDEALSEYAAVREAHPNYLPALLGMGLCRMRMGDTERARADLSEFVAGAAHDATLGPQLVEARALLDRLP